MDLSNRVAVVTGGASGIGRAVAAAMARRGVEAVALVDMSGTVEEVAAELNAEAGRTIAVPFQGDTTDESFRTSVFDAMGAKYGKITLHDGAVMQGNFNDYPVVRMSEMPVVNLLIFRATTSRRASVSRAFHPRCRP